MAENRLWANLPQELLSSIANNLTSDTISILIFRSICHSWRLSCPRPLHNTSILDPHNTPILDPLLPLSIPLRSKSYRYETDDGRSSSSFLSVTTICVLKRPAQLSSDNEFSPLLSDSWMVFVDEFAAGKISIRKPFSRDSFNIPINFPKKIDLTEFNIHEVGRFYNISCSFSYSRLCQFTSYDLSKPRFSMSQKLLKVVKCLDGFAAIALFKGGELELYRLNEVDNDGVCKSETMHDGKEFKFDDIVEFNGRVLGVDRDGRVYQIQYHSSEITPFLDPIDGAGERQKRFVESLGGLYLVVRCTTPDDHCRKYKTHKRPNFKVYELNGMKTWVQITALGDRCFVFGTYFSFSASTQDLGNYLKNSILFVKYTFEHYNVDAHDAWTICGLKNLDLDVNVWHLADDDNAIRSHPLYSDSLWPPPSWIWNGDRLKRIEMLKTAVNEMHLRAAAKLKAYSDERKRLGLDSTNAAISPLLMRNAESDVCNLEETVKFYSEKEAKFVDELRELMTMSNKVDSGPTYEELLRSAVSKFRKRYADLFTIEEEVTEVDMYLKPW